MIINKSEGEKEEEVDARIHMYVLTDHLLICARISYR